MPPPSHCRLLALLLAVAVLGPARAAETSWKVQLGVSDIARYSLLQPEREALIRRAGNLAGQERPGGFRPIVGGVTWTVDVPTTGWYELFLLPDAGDVEIVLDGDESLFMPWGRGAAPGDPGAKAGNVWLKRGKRSLEVRRDHWAGLPPVTGVVLREASEDPARHLNLTSAAGPNAPVLRAGDSLPLEVTYGDLAEATRLRADLLAEGEPKPVASASVELSAGEGLHRETFTLPCPKEGLFRVEVSLNDRPVALWDAGLPRALVLDATPVAPSDAEVRWTRVTSIDMADRAPDYEDSAGSRVVTKPFGKYRETGDQGFLQAMHTNPEKISGFAYKITLPEANRLYRFEVDYPDDTLRTPIFELREGDGAAVPVGVGADAGGSFRNTQRMQTTTFLYWPKTTDLRLVVLNPQTGLRAAASALRISLTDDALSPLAVAHGNGRHFMNWYEEGVNFAPFYGGRTGSLEGMLPALKNWPRAVAWMGADTLMPTVAVYQSVMYPSRYHRDFTSPAGDDLVRALLIECERFGLRFIGEFHPEARELQYAAAPFTGPRPNTLASRTGEIHETWDGVPRHSPLHPANQKWMLGMIGEFVDRYRDSPAFTGVSLRFMTWQNPALTNFHSLDWGYDDDTIGQFEKETGTRIPVPDTAGDRYSRRYDWLMAHAKEKWITWRCQKITDWIGQLRDRVRKARPDLTLYLPVHWDPIFAEPGSEREAGLDLKALARLSGVEVINARHAYGRRNDSATNQRIRNLLTNPDDLRSMIPKGENGKFLFGQGYFEANEKVVPAKALGYATTRNPWMSGVVYPSGRSFLERYALALAAADASQLGDGGNGLTLGEPILRDFLKEYRSLPTEPFRLRSAASDPVAVWEQSRRREFVFYLVNRKPVAVTTRLRVTLPKGETEGVSRLATGAAVSLSDGTLEVEVPPFGLRTYLAPEGTRLETITESQSP